MYLDGTMYNGHLAILHRPESYYEDSETASSTIGRLVSSLLYIVSSGISVLFVSRNYVILSMYTATSNLSCLIATILGIALKRLERKMISIEF